MSLAKTCSRQKTGKLDLELLPTTENRWANRNAVLLTLKLERSAVYCTARMFHMTLIWSAVWNLHDSRVLLFISMFSSSRTVAHILWGLSLHVELDLSNI